MKTLLLIDANSLIHRSFHALPPFTSPDGEASGALYGLSSILLKIIKEQKPDYWAAAFDRPEPTFRKEIYKEYKIQRPAAPPELISQIIKTRELLEKFGVKFFERPGFEADDLIASLATLFQKEKGLKIVILTGDLDTLQLVVGEKIVVETPKKGVSEMFVYNEKAVQERYGLNPEQLPDYKALAGDPSDNIPGVPGIGPKTASRLLAEFYSLENFYRRLKTDDAQKIPQKNQKLFQKLLENEELAFFSKKLVLLKKDIELEVSLEDLICQSQEELNGDLTDYFQRLGFQSLLKRLSVGEIASQNHSVNLAVKNNQIVFLFDRESALTRKEDLVSDKIKVGFDLKCLIKELRKENLQIAEPFFDLKIAGWLLDPDQKDFSLEFLCRRFLKRNSGERQEVFLSLFKFFSQKLKEYELNKVFEEIEMPLIKPLALMEERGIKINKPKLQNLDRELTAEIQELENKIYQEAGSVFNLNSPKQVAEILFEKLKLGHSKSLSTDAQHLSFLKEEHPVVELILTYRELFKIKSSFVEPIMAYLGEDTRLRATFNQTGAATGRLSSEKPNLQNIPTESEEPFNLRRVFESEPGFSLAAFDYSQIELRILASLSGDEKMKKAFFEEQDIHQLTASQVFNVSLEEVAPAMRRVAKTLNFGVVYGMGAEAFARTSGLSRERAEEFIAEYFSDFPAIKKWQEEIKDQARSLGFIRNLNGRRRWFRELSPTAGYLQFEAERAAINMPVQSLAADIIKMAMDKTFQLNPEFRLLLSLHDELLFEIKDDMLKTAVESIKEVMETVYQLSVPLRVNVKSGKNWGELRNYENKNH